MQLTGNIWRRHYNGKRLFAAVYLGMKIFFIQPFFIEAVLNIRRIIVFFQFLRGAFSLFLMFSRLMVFSLESTNGIFAVILGFYDFFDQHIITGLVIDLDMDSVPFFMTFNGLSQRGFNAD